MTASPDVRRAPDDVVEETAAGGFLQADTLRRRHGRYYTPAWLAEEMTSGALAAFSAEHDDAKRPELIASGSMLRPVPLTILDPSCGEGVFLVAALRAFCAPLNGSANWPRRFEVATRSTYGADNDSGALAAACEALVDVVAPPDESRRFVTEAISRNLVLGDALTGQGLDDSSLAGDADAATAPEPLDTNRSLDPNVPAIHWGRAFPNVAAAGGFDLVLGNPPYRRERDARETFERLAQSPLGRRWRQARMDLWHYFAHRGLDLLKPGGRLAFVVSGYWSSSRSAEPLIRRLQNEATFEEIRSLGTARVFAGVQGRHMTFRLRKGCARAKCVIREGETSRRVPQHELFSGNRLILAPRGPLVTAERSSKRLGDRFEVRQGIAENPPVIARSHLARRPGDFIPGEGVFVLSDEEISRRPWNEAERRTFRPYFVPRQVDRFRMPVSPHATLLYLTGRTAPSLEGMPHIAAHLNRFRPILETRREVQRGRIAWWHLHWPREERLFVQPRILAVQMVREPRFAVATAPTFVGFSLNVITSKGNRLDSENDLHALCGLLNSSVAREWFETHAKRRGVNLDVGGTVLKEFPLPEWGHPTKDAIAALAKKCASGPSDGPHVHEIDEMVSTWRSTT